MHSHPEKWAAILARQTGVDAADYLAWRKQEVVPPRLVAVDDKAISDQRGAAELFAKAGLIDRTVDLSAFWDRRYTKLLGG